MANHDNFPGLRERALILFANFSVFYVAYAAASGIWSPTGGIESVWLLSALALWFLNLLSSPWFVPPRDALINSVGAMAILVTMDLGTVSKFKDQLDIMRWVAVIYCLTVTTLSIFALFLHDRNQTSPMGRYAFRLTGIYGKGEILYTSSAIIGIIGAYQESLATVYWLLILWTIFVIARPFKLSVAAWHSWNLESASKDADSIVGTIDRIDHPNIIRVRLTRVNAWKPRTLHIAAMPNGDEQYVLSLFTQMQGAEVIGTGLCVANVAEKLHLPTSHVCQSHDEEKTAQFIEQLSGTKGAELIGFTVENSTINSLRFEVAVSSELEEGDVIFSRIGGHEVFYQIVDAETSEESFDRNPRGTHIVRAAQLGCYAPESGFTKYPWLPGMNSPLFLARNRNLEKPRVSEREFIIGNVPSTNIGVVANVDDLIEFHTAILGVTGTGKTELALDIVREAVGRSAKVFCVDFTGDYKSRLGDLNPVFIAPTNEEAADLEAKLFAAETGAYGAGPEKKALKEGIDALRASTSEHINEFLEEDEHNLAIFELGEITNTKATLRLTELHLSTIMSWAREHRRARQVMIVLEEAHTIVPETGGAGFDYDTQWVVGRIGQIALQGRKYGVGLLVITQRTALVSKTILSQCNTFFTHSLIDQTSLNFLESVYSSQHTRLIPNLPNLHCLAFGKALRAERPIVLKREFDPKKKEASEQLRKPLPTKKRHLLVTEVNQLPPRRDS